MKMYVKRSNLVNYFLSPYQQNKTLFFPDFSRLEIDQNFFHTFPYSVGALLAVLRFHFSLRQIPTQAQSNAMRYYAIHLPATSCWVAQIGRVRWPSRSVRVECCSGFSLSAEPALRSVRAGENFQIFKHKHSARLKWKFFFFKFSNTNTAHVSNTNTENFQIFKHKHSARLKHKHSARENFQIFKHKHSARLGRITYENDSFYLKLIARLRTQGSGWIDRSRIWGWGAAQVTGRDRRKTKQPANKS